MTIDNKKIIETIKDYKSKGNSITVAIGTDSQNHEETKVVTVVAIRNVGKGGVYFHDITFIECITDMRIKMFYETNESLKIARKLKEIFIENNIDEEIIIHSDVGRYGKTKILADEIIEKVNDSGFNCCIKPESWASSSIADMISK